MTKQKFKQNVLKIRELQKERYSLLTEILKSFNIEPLSEREQFVFEMIMDQHLMDEDELFDLVSKYKT